MDDELTADARRFGMSESDIADLHASLSTTATTGFSGVWPQNAEAVTAFLVSSSQWRTVLALRDEGLRTRWIGLDYAGARVALNELDITVTPKIWAGLMTMEQAARDALNGD